MTIASRSRLLRFCACTSALFAVGGCLGSLERSINLLVSPNAAGSLLQLTASPLLELATFLFNA